MGAYNASPDSETLAIVRQFNRIAPILPLSSSRIAQIRNSIVKNRPVGRLVATAIKRFSPLELYADTEIDCASSYLNGFSGDHDLRVS